MIEVEKKFQPTSEQLEKLLSGAEFLGEKTIHDLYYDYPDYRMFKKDDRLRDRSGSFELKVSVKGGVAYEIDNEEEIKKYFGTEMDLKEFINQNLISFIDYTTYRKKYIKDGFSIDVDQMSFGDLFVEIELLVESEDSINEAENKILEISKSFGMEPKGPFVKREAYFTKVKPELYETLFGKTK